MGTDAESLRCSGCGAPLPAGSRTAWCAACALHALMQGDPAEPGTEILSLRDIPAAGTTLSYIGDYELLEVIAYGGMGVVYQGRQRSLNRIVGLKLLLGGQHASQDFKKRFRQEAAMAAKLQHPNIVPIYEVGEHEGQPYFSMEYVAGTNLANFTREQPLPPRKAAEYLKTVAEAIAYAHQQGVIHRDLKPSNILLGSDDRPRITDFGLARQMDANSSLTASGEVLGTPGYLPPEQASTKKNKAGPHSDVYALGGVLHYLLTGRPPFLAGTLADTLQQVLKSEPIPLRRLNPVIPRDLETICLKCLEKAPERRYETAQALVEDLKRFLAGQPILARQASISERVAKWYKREPMVSGLATAVVFVLLLGLGISLSQWHRARFERDAAKAARDDLKRKASELEDAQRFLAQLRKTKDELDPKIANSSDSGRVPTLSVAKSEAANIANWQPALGEGMAQMLITELAHLTNFKVLESVGLNDLRAENVSGEKLTVFRKVEKMNRAGDIVATAYEPVPYEPDTSGEEARFGGQNPAGTKGKWRGPDYTLKTVIRRFGPKPPILGGAGGGANSIATNEYEVQIDWRIVNNASREIVRGAAERAVGTERGNDFNVSLWHGGELASDRGFMDSALAKATFKALSQVVERVRAIHLTSNSQPSTSANPKSMELPAKSATGTKAPNE